MKPIRILIVLCVSLLLLAQLLQAQADKPAGDVEPSYDFRKTRWGMTQRQVIAKEGKPLSRGKDSLLYTDIQLLSVESILMFYFINDRLYRAAYMCTEEFSEPNTYLSASAKWIEALKNKYGKPQTDLTWLNDLYRNDSKRFAFAISAGHLRILNSWETDRTRISHLVRGENFEIKIGVIYTSKKYSTEAEKAEKEKQQDLF